MGQRLAARFRLQAHNVTVITRSQNRHSLLEELGCHCLTRDITHPGFSLPRAEYSRVYLCAAPTVDRRKLNYGESLYVKGTFCLLRQLDKIKFTGKLYVIGSSSMLKCLENYPHRGKNLVPFTEENLETAPKGPENPSYGQYRILREWSSKSDFKIFHVISAGQYGPDRHPGKRVMDGLREKSDNPRRWLNLIHIEDLENALHFIEENNLPMGPYLLADENPITVQDLYDLYAKKLGIEPVEFLPSQNNEVFPDNCCRIIPEKLKSKGFQIMQKGISKYLEKTRRLI